MVKPFAIVWTCCFILFACCNAFLVLPLTRNLAEGLSTQTTLVRAHFEDKIGLITSRQHPFSPSIARAQTISSQDSEGSQDSEEGESAVVKDQLSPDEWKKVGPALSLGGLKLNLFGAIFLVMSCFFYAPIWLAGLYTVKLLHQIKGKDWDSNLLQYDNMSKWWARSVLRTGMCWPSIEGSENIPPEDEAVMFVANHTSWFDIVCISLVMATRPFKFVSKAELLKVPVMGTSLKLGGHVLISRENRASQLATFKEGVRWLKRGVSLINYAEGTRSKDGRLKRFKRGAIKMAMQAKVKVVPISLVGMHRAFPSWAVMPICPGGDFMKVVVHKPIETEGKDEKQIMIETFDAIKSGLPLDQQ